MKLLHTIFLILIVFTSSLFSQTYETFTAKDGYDYLVSTGEVQDMKLVQIMAMGTTGMEMLETDIPTGTATNWTYSYMSNNSSNKTLYTWIVLKMVGTFIAIQDSTPDNEETFDNPLTSINWVNSDIIGKNFKNSGSAYEYYTKNVDNFSYKYMFCMYEAANDTLSGYFWIVAFSIDGTDGGGCLYSAKTGDPILCDFSEVGIKDTRAIIESHFPNPSTGIINFQTDIIGEVQIQLFDINGGLIRGFSKEINSDFQLNVSDLANGVYNVVITSPKGAFNRKIIIAR